MASQRASDVKILVQKLPKLSVETSNTAELTSQILAGKPENAVKMVVLLVL